MANIILTDKEKFKLAAQLTQGLVNKNWFNDYDSDETIIKNKIVNHYQILESALKKLNQK